MTPWMKTVPVAFLCAAALLPVRAAAQQTPEEVAVAYYEAYRDGRLQEMTALTHPRALEWFKDTFVRALEQEGPQDDEFNPATLRALPADSVYLRMIGGASEEQRFAAMMADVRMEPIGHLPEGDSVAHVVYVGRGTMGGAAYAQTMAITLRRHEGRWRVDPGESMIGMMGASVMYLVVAASMQDQLTGTPQP